jgi:choline kinase
VSGPVAIVLAAGVGSRLRPLTDDRPKCLVPVGRETIVHRMMRLLAAQGVSRFVVSTGYLEDVLREALMEAPRPVTFVSNPDYASTQNVISLHRALAQLAPDESFVKLDGDVLFDEAVIARMLAADGDARVAVERSTTLGDEEMKVMVENGRVSRFGKRIDPTRAHGESIGIEWFAASAARRVKKAIDSAVRAGRTDLYYEDVYNDVLGDVVMRAVSVDASEWMEVDDAADLERARRRFG